MRLLPHLSLFLLAACGGDSWEEVASMSTPRWAHTATLLQDGDVLVVGGYGQQGEAIPLVERWDGQSWTAAAPLPQARSEHTATLLADGRVLVAGGRIGNARLRTALVYLPNSDQWGELPDMPFGRGGHTATLLPDGRVFFFGGSTDYSSPGPMIFDPADNSWLTWDGLEDWSREGCGAALLGDGTILLAGGLAEVDPTTRRLVASDESRRFDPTAEGWLDGASLYRAHAWGGMAASAGGTAVMAGGTTLPEPTEGDAMAGVEAWDGDSWRVFGDLSEPRMRALTLTSRSENVLVIGGDRTHAHASDAVDVVDMRRSEVRPGEPMPAARAQHAGVVLENGRVLVTGGWDGYYARSETLIYTPAGRDR